MPVTVTRCLHDLYNLVRLQLNLTLQNTDRPLRHQFGAATCGLQPHQGQDEFLCDISPSCIEALMQSKKTGPHTPRNFKGFALHKLCQVHFGTKGNCCGRSFLVAFSAFFGLRLLAVKNEAQSFLHLHFVLAQIDHVVGKAHFHLSKPFCFLWR